MVHIDYLNFECKILIDSTDYGPIHTIYSTQEQSQDFDQKKTKISMVQLKRRAYMIVKKKKKSSTCHNLAVFTQIDNFKFN